MAKTQAFQRPIQIVGTNEHQTGEDVTPQNGQDGDCGKIRSESFDKKRNFTFTFLGMTMVNVKYGRRSNEIRGIINCSP